MAAIPVSRSIVLAGLLALALATPWWLASSGASLGLAWCILLGATGPALLFYATLQKKRNWSGITALCMIPLACIGVMDIVASSGAINSGMLLGVISIGTFFAVLDAGRREPN